MVCQYYDRPYLRNTASRSPEIEDAGLDKLPRMPDVDPKSFETCLSCSGVPCPILSFGTVVPHDTPRHSSEQAVRRLNADLSVCILMDKLKKFILRYSKLFLLPLAAAALAGCPAATKSSSPSNPNTPPSGSSVTVAVSPASANVRAGATKSFGASVAGSSNTAVTWQVNGVAGGSAATGTISSSGMYTAPTTVPGSNIVTARAVSSADATATGSSAVTLQNPLPVLTIIAPPSVPAGAFAITVGGSGFVRRAQVLLAGAPLATTFVSSTQLTATGNEASAGTFSIAVMNPDPGSTTSASQNLQVTSTSGGNPPPSCSGMSLGQSASLNGFVPFPADNLWNKDISSAPVDANSAAIINFIGSGIGLHPDFGSGLYNGQSMGIPYLVVGAQQGPVPIAFTAYGDESDPGPMPIPVSALIEGYPAPGSGDRHVLVLDNNNCWLYELYSSYPNAASWNAGSAAVWDLAAGEQRPYTRTSADAAGLPIFPGLARYDEVTAGHINHALRVKFQSKIGRA